MKAYLMLEDGSLYAGEARGDFRETPCEVVFNTSMTGYVEILTDPSYAGQGIVMTYPMIGNYGVSKEDFESDKLQPCAFLVHELCDTPSNFRNTQTIDSLLKEYGIPCMSGLDTRAVVKKLRESGTMRGVITDDISDKDRLMQVIKDFRQEKLVERVPLREKRVRGEENSGAKIALMDFGTKRNITNNLVKRGCVVTEYPAWTTAEEVLRDKPDGIMLSNGPGDPAAARTTRSSSYTRTEPIFPHRTTATWSTARGFRAMRKSTASTSTTKRSRALSITASRFSPCSSTPKRAPARGTHLSCLTDS